MLEAIDEGASLRNAEIKFKILRSMLQRHYNRKKRGANMKRQGGQLALGEDITKHLVQTLLFCDKWGYPVDKYDQCCIVKRRLDKKGVQHAKFKNNSLCQALSTIFLFFFFYCLLSERI